MTRTQSRGTTLCLLACAYCAAVRGQTPLSIANQSFSSGLVGRPYLQGLHTSGGCTGPAAPLPSFSVVAGSLPPGLQIELISSVGPQIDGVPTAPGAFNFTLNAVDVCQQSATKTYSIVITVSSTPIIAVSTQLLSFSYVIGNGDVAAQTVQIDNKGEGTLNWRAAAGAPWIRVSPVSGTAPSSLKVSVNPNSFDVGVYLGAMTISDDAASGSPQTVLVRLTVRTSGTSVVIDSVKNASTLAVGAITQGEIMTISGTGLGPPGSASNPRRVASRCFSAFISCRSFDAPSLRVHLQRRRQKAP